MRLLLLFFISSLLLSCSTGDPEPTPSNPTPTPTPTPVTPDPPAVTPRTDFTGIIRDMTSMELVAEMGVGWNMGNSFDVIDVNKTAWGNPLPTAKHIEVVKEMGFGTLRIPVTWGFNQSASAPYMIEAAYLDKVQEVVNYGFSNHMHVIINVHHDDDWVKPLNSDAEQVKDRLASLWTQVAERFQTYGDSLIFETLNEPRLKGSAQEWSGGTAEGRAVINDYHKAALDAIRATGGNNEKRHVMISTYAASTVPAAMDELVIPNDDPNIIISHHTYFPWSFTGEDNGVATWGTDQEKADLDAELDRVRDKWTSHSR